jgi:hypothetical protein
MDGWRTRFWFLLATAVAGMVVGVSAISYLIGRSSKIEEQPQTLRVEFPSLPKPKKEAPLPATPFDQPIRRGDIEVRLVSVKLDKRPNSLEKRLAPCVLIRFQVANVGKDRRYEFDVLKAPAGLSDDQGNSYSASGFDVGEEKTLDQFSPILAPGESATDMVAYAEPLGTATTLFFELDAESVSDAAVIRPDETRDKRPYRFSIPMSHLRD